jgi:hypothetical protein
MRNICCRAQLGVDRYALTTTTSTRGRFRFDALPTGRYTVESDCVRRAALYAGELTVEGAMTVIWEIAPPPAAVIAPEMAQPQPRTPQLCRHRRA